MFIDTHCHPLLQKDKDITTILENLKSSDGKYLISVGTDINSSQESLKLAQQHKNMFTTVGIHPSDVMEHSDHLEKSISVLEELYLEDPTKVVGIGECGLDYYRIDKNNIEKDKKIQKDFFIAQINLARKYNLPLIIHNRDAGTDILNVLAEQKYQNFIIHCYSEDIDFAKKCLEISPDCYFSFSGIVTFSNASKIAAAAAFVPLKNILIETDAPYLTPAPLRGKEENEPAFTKYILEKIQALREESPEEIEEQIYQNSLNVYHIKETN